MPAEDKFDQADESTWLEAWEDSINGKLLAALRNLLTVFGLGITNNWIRRFGGSHMFGYKHIGKADECLKELRQENQTMCPFLLHNQENPQNKGSILSPDFILLANGGSHDRRRSAAIALVQEAMQTRASQIDTWTPSSFPINDAELQILLTSVLTGMQLEEWEAQQLADHHQVALMLLLVPKLLQCTAFRRQRAQAMDTACYFVEKLKMSPNELVNTQPWAVFELLWFNAKPTDEIANLCIDALQKDPALAQKVAAEPDLVPELIHEVMRLNPPVHVIPFEIDGKHVGVNLSKATVDTHAFPDPYKLQLDRTAKGQPTKELNFASASPDRYCVGCDLAMKLIERCIVTYLNAKFVQ